MSVDTFDWRTAGRQDGYRTRVDNIGDVTKQNGVDAYVTKPNSKESVVAKRDKTITAATKHSDESSNALYPFDTSGDLFIDCSSETIVKIENFAFGPDNFFTVPENFRIPLTAGHSFKQTAGHSFEQTATAVIEITDNAAFEYTADAAFEHIADAAFEHTADAAFEHIADAAFEATSAATIDHPTPEIEKTEAEPSKPESEDEESELTDSKHR